MPSMKSHLFWRVGFKWGLGLGLSLGLGLLVSCKPAPSHLLFASARSGNWEIFLQAADDSGPQNLTRYPSVDRYPDWSPDRRELVFASDRKGSFDLYLLNADGNNLRLLTESPYPDTTPRWAKQGILFVSEREDRNEEIYLIDPKGQNLRRLTKDPAADYDPAWSPDGKCLFISLRSGQSELYRIDPSAPDAKPEQLTHNRSDKRSPDVSADGMQIVFSERKGKNWQLVSLDLKSGKISPLTQDSGWQGMPRWRSNGTLLYTQAQGNSFQLMQRSPDGQSKALFNSAGPDREASWP